MKRLATIAMVLTVILTVGEAITVAVWGLTTTTVLTIWLVAATAWCVLLGATSTIRRRDRQRLRSHTDYIIDQQARKLSGRTAAEEHT